MKTAEAVDRYLQGKHCVLWPAVTFDLTDDKERIAATLWLIDAMRDVRLLEQTDDDA